MLTVRVAVRRSGPRLSCVSWRDWRSRHPPLLSACTDCSLSCWNDLRHTTGLSVSLSAPWRSSLRALSTSAQPLQLPAEILTLQDFDDVLDLSMKKPVYICLSKSSSFIAMSHRAVKHTLGRCVMTSFDPQQNDDVTKELELEAPYPGAVVLYRRSIQEKYSEVISETSLEKKLGNLAWLLSV